MADFRGIVKDLVWQFAYRGNDHSGKWLSTGGLLALQIPLKNWVGMTRIMSRGAAVNIPVARPGLHAAPRYDLICHPQQCYLTMIPKTQIRAMILALGDWHWRRPRSGS